MEMEAVCNELDELKQAMEVLREDYRAKSELSDNLRRAHNEQLAKLQEAKATIEKQSQEMDAKAEEISLARKSYEDLKSRFAEKESMMKNLSLASDNLRTSSREKLVKLDEENKALISALDEANLRRKDLEEKISLCKKEIEGLKLLLSQSQKKCSEAEERAHASQELRWRDELLRKVEQQKGKVEDQLKWKSEQFRHLEEAHSKLQDEFQASEKEWSLERCNLLNEMSSLQMNLDKQTRAVEDLSSRLQMCNQALAHEESRRKLLEIQMLESKALYENVVLEYEEARSSISTLTANQAAEIATLRNSLVTKEAHFKEMEYRNAHLEQENVESRISLKAFQEAQINGAETNAALKTLRQKFKVLEQTHKNCSATLRAKETEWNAQTDKLGRELDDCLSKLSSKSRLLSHLQAELEGSHSLLVQQKLENEETSVLFIVYKSKFLESSIYLEGLKLDINRSSEQAEENITFLMEQLEKKNNDLLQAQAEIKIQLETVHALQKKIDFIESTNQDCVLLLNKRDMYRGMLEDSSRSFDCYKKQAFQKENDLQEKLRRVSDALDVANTSLAEKTRDLDMYKGLLEESSRNFNNFREQALQKERDLQGDLRKVSDALDKANSALTEKTREFGCCKAMLEETSKSIDQLKEQAIQRESQLQGDLRKVMDALDQANSSVAEKTNEATEAESQVQELKSTVERLERLKFNLECELCKIHEESIAIRNDLDVCLLEKTMAEEAFMQERNSLHRESQKKDRAMEDLQHQIVMMEENQAKEHSEWAALSNLSMQKKSEEKEKLLIAEDECERLKDKLNKKDQEYTMRLIEVSRSIEQEKDKFLEAMMEKECVIAIIQQQALSMRRDFAELVEYAATLKLSHDERINEPSEMIISALVLDELDIKYKSWLLAEAEKELCNLRYRLELEEKLSLDLKKSMKEMEVESVRANIKIENEKVRLENEMKCIQANNNILKAQVQGLIGNIDNFHTIISQFSLEREEMKDHMLGFSNLAEEAYKKDKAVAEILEKLTKKAQDDDAMKAYKVENNKQFSSPRNKALESFDRRMPLKEQNC